MMTALSRLRTWLTNKYTQYEYARPFGATATLRRYLGVVMVTTPVHIYLSYWFMQKTAEPELRELAHALSMAHSTMILPSCVFIGMCLFCLTKRRYEQLLYTVMSLTFISISAYIAYLDASIGGSSGQGVVVFLMVITGLSVIIVAPPYVTVPFFVFTIIGAGIGMYQLSNEIYSNNPGLLANLLLTIPWTITLSTLAWSQFSDRMNLRKSLKATQKLLERTKLELESVVETDPVTGLYNHRKFNEIAARDFCTVARQCGKDEENGYLLIDLNNLAKINQDHGFDSGDKALRKLGRLLLRETRATDVTGRAYSDVFAVFLPATNLAEAVSVAEKLRVAIETYTMVSLETGDSARRESYVTVNIGVTSGTEPPFSDDGSPSALFTRAKQALADSKGIGRNLVVSVPGPINRSGDSK